MDAYEHIGYDATEGIAEIVLDRPDVLNAFHADMIDELVTALADAQADDDVYVLVLTGAGRGFCSGADVGGMGGRDRSRLEDATRLWKVQNVVRHLYHGPKPTIAAVNGPALGAGCDFALACDLRIMEKDAYLREQFVNIGLVPGDGGGWLLPRLVGEAKAKEYVLTGKDITPSAAEDLGLVVDVVESGSSRDAARELAVDLRDKPAVAMQRSKELLDATQSYEEYAQAAIEAQWEARMDPEHSEAVSALREDRDPAYDRTY